jgi:hypothetical protein
MCLERSSLLHSNQLFTRDGRPFVNLHPLLFAFSLADSAGGLCPLRLTSQALDRLSRTRVSCAHSCRLAFGWML